MNKTPQAEENRGLQTISATVFLFFLKEALPCPSGFRFFGIYVILILKYF
jgi:hypothetical protein